MKNNTLVVTIQKPVAEVFLFTITPSNTPLWVDEIVQYIFTPLGPVSTKLEYREWVEEGELADPFLMATIKKLKNILER